MMRDSVTGPLTRVGFRTGSDEQPGVVYTIPSSTHYSVSRRFPTSQLREICIGYSSIKSQPFVMKISVS